MSLALTPRAFHYNIGLSLAESHIPPSYAAAGYVKYNIPIYCGGESKSRRYINGRWVDQVVRRKNCYAFSAFIKRWVQIGAMLLAKAYHAASSHPDLGMIITGGWDMRNYATVETTRDGVNFDRSMPDLPETKSGHCQVTTDKNTIMVFGGCERNCQMTSSFKLDLDSKKWTKMADMPRGRHRLTCQVVKEGGMAIQVITAGGFYNNAPSDAVDIFDLSTMEWKKGW